uniref:ubiquitin-conjugating enzyme E2 D2-like n=1 Tax=Styela clava TaxID=7725 RepID=UPI0019397992|nr:ubiquitin-conjugating enzyme E2 D2-like [Styela clava]XP_039266775.1 ubiquitin-conjugating enzyme E2 D2-like [Styela clava]
MALRRLQYEYNKLVTNSKTEFPRVKPINDENLFEWRAEIEGPVGTPYEGGIFKIFITYPTDYPFKPPKLHFETKIYHPNISEKGFVCVDILQKQWSPALTTSKILLSITSLLATPNPDDPMNSDAARLYLQDRRKYYERAKLWTSQQAM